MTFCRAVPAALCIILEQDVAIKALQFKHWRLTLPTSLLRTGKAGSSQRSLSTSAHEHCCRAQWNINPTCSEAQIEPLSETWATQMSPIGLRGDCLNWETIIFDIKFVAVEWNYIEITFDKTKKPFLHAFNKNLLCEHSLVYWFSF